MKKRVKIAAVCRIIQSTTKHLCACGQVASYLISMNVLRKPERRFVCEGCLNKLPKAVPFEEGARAWMSMGYARDIRMVNHAHAVGYGSGATRSIGSHGNRTAALKFED